MDVAMHDCIADGVVAAERIYGAACNPLQWFELTLSDTSCTQRTMEFWGLQDKGAKLGAGESETV